MFGSPGKGFNADGAGTAEQVQKLGFEYFGPDNIEKCLFDLVCDWPGGFTRYTG